MPSESNVHLGPDALAERLRIWLDHHRGWLNPDVHIGHDDSCGFHARARKPLSSPVVVKCPVRLSLSYLNLDHSQDHAAHINSPLQALLGKIPNQVLTYLLLIELRLQSVRNEASEWEPYIACLPGPESMTTPLWFTEEDMEYLQGTNLAQAAVTTRERWSQEWQHAIDAMRKCKLENLDDFSFELYCWAATIVSSRAFSSHEILPDVEKSAILWPVVDILNHSTTAKVEWDFRRYDSFTITSRDDIDEGAELFNNYAPKQNDELLLGYGFCIPDNPSEQFAVKIALPVEKEQHYIQKKAFSAEHIPFDMSPSSLEEDRKQAQAFLRPRGHPFGRYENSVPSLRGIPPYVVHLNFLAVLASLNIDLATINPTKPPARVFIKTLLGLYQAIKLKSDRLPLHTALSPTNAKQHHATIYRTGQASIIHSICAELEAPIHRRRVHDRVPGPHPAILTSTEALLLLAQDFPSAYGIFASGLESCYAIDPSLDYTPQVSAQGSEDTVWMLLLIAFATIVLDRNNSHSDSLLFAWMHDLFRYYPLSSFDPAHEDDAANLEYLAPLVEHFVDEAATREALNGQGVPFNPPNDSFVVNGTIRNLGDSIVVWAARTFLDEGFVLPDQEDGSVPRQCMYFVPWREERWDEWMFEGGAV